MLTSIYILFVMKNYVLFKILILFGMELHESPNISEILFHFKKHVQIHERYLNVERNKKIFES